MPPVARGSLDVQDAGDEGDDDDEGAIVQFAAVSTLSVHDVAPDTVYPELHVGWHVEPLERVSVQSPAAPSPPPPRRAAAAPAHSATAG